MKYSSKGTERSSSPKTKLTSRTYNLKIKTSKKTPCPTINFNSSIRCHNKAKKTKRMKTDKKMNNKTLKKKFTLGTSMDLEIRKKWTDFSI